MIVYGRQNILKVQKHIKLCVIIFVLLFSVSMQASCMKDIASNNSFNKSQILNSEAYNSIPPEEVASGTLRLWIQNPVTLNPLVSNNYQWNSMSKLFYDGLFDIDSSQKLINNLAKDYEISDDGLRYTITLKDKIVFQDNTTLDSLDVLATTLFIQKPENLSIYFSRLTNISLVNVIDNKKIVFMLKSIDPFFPYELTFPILPSEKITNAPLDYIPGTGQYKVTAINKDKNITAVLNTLASLAKENKVKKINILILENTRKAMEAFGDDKLDMIVLRDEYYNQYYLRNDVKIIRYPGERFSFFEINTDLQKISGDVNKFNYIKTLLQDAALYDGTNGVFLAATKFPFMSSSPLVHGGECKDIIKIKKIENAFAKETRKLDIIYLSSDPMNDALIAQLKILLDKAKILYNINGLTKDNYDKAITSRQYDLVLREARLPDNPDPSWLYLNETIRPINGIQTLIKTGLEQFNKKQEELLTNYKTPKISVTPDEFCSLVNSLYSYGPFSGIGFRLNGVILSKRIHGQLDSNAFNNYNNIKDVWVWSGQ